MNRTAKAVLAVALLVVFSAPGRAQTPEKLTPLKVQVVFSEYEGEKKVANLPYTLLVNASEGKRGERSSIRVGVRVPISTQGKEGLTTQYLNVGTDIDANAESVGGVRYALTLNLRRSFLYSPSEKGDAQYVLPADQPVPMTPMFRHFEAEFRILCKDGETVETTWATDPVSGRVLKVDVTVNVVK